MVRKAVLLIIRRSWVRAPPAPPAIYQNVDRVVDRYRPGCRLRPAAGAGARFAGQPRGGLLVGELLTIPVHEAAKPRSIQVTSNDTKQAVTA